MPSEKVTAEKLREWADRMDGGPDADVDKGVIAYLRSEAARLEQPVDDTELRAALAQSEARAEKWKAHHEAWLGLVRAANDAKDDDLCIWRTAIAWALRFEDQKALAADPTKPEKDAG